MEKVEDDSDAFTDFSKTEYDNKTMHDIQKDFGVVSQFEGRLNEFSDSSDSI